MNQPRNGKRNQLNSHLCWSPVRKGKKEEIVTKKLHFETRKKILAEFHRRMSAKSGMKKLNESSEIRPQSQPVNQVQFTERMSSSEKKCRL
jgi:hypothetical protein